MSESDVSDPERIAKISKIMPEFTKVAAVGDKVLMGLKGDACFPYSTSRRPTATITAITPHGSDIQVDLKLDDGSKMTTNMYSYAPSGVWEYTEKSFADVVGRVKAKQNRQRATSMHRAEQPVATADTSIAELKSMISSLRAELAAERQLTRNFHNTYIHSMSELANDVRKIDNITGGKSATFCKTFGDEYALMKSRGELGVYRGAFDEDCEEEEGDKYYSQSDNSMSDEDVAASDWF